MKEHEQEALKALGLPADATAEDVKAAVAKLAAEREAAKSRDAAAKAALKALGLPDDADAERVAARAKELAEPPKADPPKADPPKADEYVPRGEFDRVAKELVTLREARADEAAVAAVDAATADGKLTPAMRDWGLAQAKADPTAFAAYVAAAPAMLADAAAPPGPPPADGAPTGQALAVCRALGVDPKDWAASRAALAESGAVA